MFRSRQAKIKQKRMFLLFVGIAVVAFAVILMLIGLRDTVVFFHAPAEVAQNPQAAQWQKRFRLGGLVVADSLTYEAGSSQVFFTLGDGGGEIRVAYTGALPDLFRDGQGIVALGRMHGGVFMAESLLAKHDENYMPPEVAEALKEASLWRGE